MALWIENQPPETLPVTGSTPEQRGLIFLLLITTITISTIFVSSVEDAIIVNFIDFDLITS